MKTKKVIFVSGWKRAGKDFSADTLIDLLDDLNISAEKMHFAFPLKDIVSKTFNISMDELEQYKNEPNSYKLELANSEYKTDFREILQRFGTEGMRLSGHFPENIWALLVREKIEKSNKDVIILPDWRFKNELKTILESTDMFEVVTLRIEDYELNNQDMHPSETELNDFNFDFIVNNTPIDGKKDIGMLQDALSFFIDAYIK